MNGLKMKYFVLNPTKNDNYGHASRQALRTYAKEIADENPELAEDLWKWANDIAISFFSKEEGNKMSDKVKKAFEIIKQAMIDDEPEKHGSYADSWHCNIAMCCYDAIRNACTTQTHINAHKVGNDAANRFMQLCFGVKMRT